MKYTILGAGAGLPHPDFHLSSVVVQTSEYTFLLDCGEGTSKQLVMNGFDLDCIDAVLISHYHPDHATGLYMLIQMLYLQNRKKPLKLFLPERSEAFLDSLHMFYTFEQRLPFKLHVSEMPEAEMHYPELSIALTDHLIGYEGFLKKKHYPNLMQSFCVAVTSDSRTLLYTSDINTFSNIEYLIEKADTLIIDALHPDAELIISLAENTKKRLILTHGISENLKKLIGIQNRENVEFAFENRTCTL
jgi:ribonuclease BN (tRNA processing enzyme)